MIDLLLRIGATKFGVSLALAVLALLVQRRFDRPFVSHTLWVFVLAALVVPAVITIPVPGLTAAGPVSSSVLGHAGVQDGELFFGAVSPSVLAGWLKSGLVFVWLVGAGAVLVWSLARTLRFRRLLATASRPAPPALQRLASEISGAIGLVRAPVIHTTRAHLSPMVWWTGGEVRVLVPAALLDGMDDDELRWVVAHEIAHVRRRDHMTRWLEWLACAAFWWNPVAWWARRELRAAEEFCCDAIVLASLKPGARSYGSALVTVIDFLSTPATLRMPAFASEADSGGRTKLIERRLGKIMSRNPIPTTSRRLRVGLTAAAIVILPLGLVYCGPDQAVAPEADAAEQFTAQAVSTYTDMPVGVVKGKFEEDKVEAGQDAAFEAREIRTDEAQGHYRMQQESPVRIKIEEAVRAGAITPEQGREKVSRLKEIPVERGGGTVTPMTKEAIALKEMAGRIRAAVAAGEITAEEGRRQLEEASARARNR